MDKVVLTREQVREISEAIPNVRLCVVGDVCLDIYWHADMRKSKLSRETPHHPLPVVRERYAPGACGNVIHNVHALGVKELHAVSAIGEDWRGYLLQKWFRENGLSAEGLLLRETGITPCYCKPMRMGISDVVYEDPRLDFENDAPLSPADEDRLLSALESAAREADLVAVSDQFAWGVITPRVRNFLSALAGKMPVVVDSRERISAYTGVIIKPNEVEAAMAVGADLAGDVTPETYEAIARRLQKKNGRPVIVTLGSLGALWCEGERLLWAPTVPAEAPVDVVGAGDTFLSAFCSAYAACRDGGLALAYANLASGVTVKKIGTTGTASPEEILKKWEETYGHD